MLEVAATFRGSLRLRAKPCPDTSPVTIRSAALARLSEGARVGPADAAAMPRLVAAGGRQAVVAEDGAQRYRLLGLEITHDPGRPDLRPRAPRRGGHGRRPVPDHITVDRSYVHGWPHVYLKRGVALNGAHLTLSNSHVSEVHAEAQDNQAVAGWNGPGPITITNNYLESGGENVMFGGAPPVIPGLVSSDILIRGT